MQVSGRNRIIIRIVAAVVLLIVAYIMLFPLNPNIGNPLIVWIVIAVVCVAEILYTLLKFGRRSE